MTRFATHDGIPVWTTLALTIHADGSANRQLAGASSFPRHWIYDGDGELAGQSTLIDFKTWCRHLRPLALERSRPHGDRRPTQPIASRT